MKHLCTLAVGAIVAANLSYAAHAAPGDEYLSPGCSTGSNQSFCEQGRKDFLKWYPRAFRGDYQGQRNVAFCLWDGCDGAVTPNKITSCAWRIIIVASGSLKLDASDTSHMRTCRSQLSADEMVAASGQAQTLASKIKR